MPKWSIITSHITAQMNCGWVQGLGAIASARDGFSGMLGLRLAPSPPLNRIVNTFATRASQFLLRPYAGRLATKATLTLACFSPQY